MSACHEIKHGNVALGRSFIFSIAIQVISNTFRDVPEVESFGANFRRNVTFLLSFNFIFTFFYCVT